MTMRKIITTTMFGFVLALGACDKGDADKGDKQAKTDKTDKKADDKADEAAEGGEAPEVEAPSLDPKVEKAVAVANQIAASPEQADSILEEAGLDRDSFEALLYEIAKDPELSKSYAVAREA
jgi:hypothetical protein